MNNYENNYEYKRICEKYPMLSRVIRNSLMSQVTNSSHKVSDKKEVLRALKKFKKKKRLKVMESFFLIESETKEFTDIIPNIIKFFETIKNVKK